MTNSLLQIKIKQRLNKLSSLDYDNIECWAVQEAVNKAQIEFTRRSLNGLNQKREGAEQSTSLVDDLQKLVTSEKLTLRNEDFYFESTPLESNYLRFIRVDMDGTSDCCSSRRFNVYEAEEANVSNLLRDEHRKPDFEWAETFCTLAGNKVRIYTDGKFIIDKATLIYFRLPREVKFAGCVDISLGITNSADVTCEFNDDVAEIILDEAAAILAGDIESMTQLQRNLSNSTRNT